MALQTPLTSTFTDQYGTPIYRVGAAGMQGWRRTMEDRHVIQIRSTHHPHLSYFMILDGHGGDETAIYIQKELPQQLDALIDPTSVFAIRAVFQDVDRSLRASGLARNSGCTAAVAIVGFTQGRPFLVSAHVGDSRVVVIDRLGKVKFVTTDHKPNDPEELQRVIAAGGVVVNGRVDANLNLSRAFGDFSLKQRRDLPVEAQRISVVPTVVRTDLTVGDSLMICCDGMFEAFTTEQLVQQTFHHPYFGTHPTEVANDIVRASLDAGSTDNMSYMLIHFLESTTYPTKKTYRPMVVGVEQLSNDVFYEQYRLDAKRHGFTLREVLLSLFTQSAPDSQFEAMVRRATTDDAIMCGVFHLARDINM